MHQTPLMLDVLKSWYSIGMNMHYEVMLSHDLMFIHLWVTSFRIGYLTENLG